MKDNKVFKMATEHLLMSLQQCNFNSKKIQALYPKGGLFQNIKEIQRARRIIDHFITVWQYQLVKGTFELPQTRDKMVYFVEIKVAEYLARDGVLWINSRFRDRSNRELVKEVREAVLFLREKGAENEAYVYEIFLKQQIGEELI